MQEQLQCGGVFTRGMNTIPPLLLNSFYFDVKVKTVLIRLIITEKERFLIVSYRYRYYFFLHLFLLCHLAVTISYVLVAAYGMRLL